MHTVFALLCFVVLIHWLIFPYPPGLLRWHCGNLTIAPVPAKQPWWIWINTSCEFIMSHYITTTKQSTTKPCAYLLGYTVTKLRPASILTSHYPPQYWIHCVIPGTTYCYSWWLVVESIVSLYHSIGILTACLIQCGAVITRSIFSKKHIH